MRKAHRILHLPSPLCARTRRDHVAIEPVAYNCVKFVIVREGSAQLFGDFRACRVITGDIMILAANTLCGAEPEDGITTTTLYVDREYLIDQVFWQHSLMLSDRLDASDCLERNYPEPARIVRVGESRAGLLAPWLDELEELSADGLPAEHFYRAQALLSAVLDVVTSRVPVADQHVPSTARASIEPSRFQHYMPRPIRPEARKAAKLLSEDLDRHWSVSELAGAVHLSPSQLRRVFVEAFGVPPIAHLTKLRTERMAHLLKVADSSISFIAASVGWSDPDYAAQQFRQSVGVTPSEYRRLHREGPPPHPE